jgi:hypothetical protein
LRELGADQGQTLLRITPSSPRGDPYIANPTTVAALATFADASTSDVA